VNIILIPGLWLDASSWDDVVPALEQAGHTAQPLTLPGLAAKDADRSGITLADHVDAVTAAIDAGGDERVVLVGHSLGAGIAYAAGDARPDRVARAIYIGGFPAADGEALGDGFAAEQGEVPLPDWDSFDDGDVAGLDDAARARFRERAIPVPERVTTDSVHLSDERRYDVPVTVICPEFTADQLREWIAQDMEPVREFTKIRNVEYVDLPTGHWPQFSRPADLAQAILGAVDRSDG
jgi:pimeloyl-ACP methyl ester carboxylesterase